MAKGAVYNAAPISVAFNGATLGSYTPAATSFTQITTASFTATAASGSLTFAGPTDTAAQITAIDKLSIVAAVPLIVIPNASFEAPDIGNGSVM